MTDCVIAADGLSYERAAITSWLQHSNASPVTGKLLPHTRLLPNVLLRSATTITSMAVLLPERVFLDCGSLLDITLITATE